MNRLVCESSAGPMQNILAEGEAIAILFIGSGRPAGSCGLGSRSEPNSERAGARASDLLETCVRHLQSAPGPHLPRGLPSRPVRLQVGRRTAIEKFHDILAARGRTHLTGGRFTFRFRFQLACHVAHQRRINISLPRMTSRKARAQTGLDKRRPPTTRASATPHREHPAPPRPDPKRG